MARLIARPALDRLPETVGGLTLSQVDPGRITSVAPFDRARTALSKALKAAHGVGFPNPGRAETKQGTSCLWFGRGQAMLLGPVPDPGLAAHAAVTDQSDGWVLLRLEGEGAAEVLARLVPIDLRDGAFARGRTARTLLGHMAAALTCRGPGCYEIMVFRSMARSAAHELRQAMRSVAARAG